MLAAITNRLNRRRGLAAAIRANADSLRALSAKFRSLTEATASGRQ
jgi:hypothetical protein